MALRTVSHMLSSCNPLNVRVSMCVTDRQTNRQTGTEKERERGREM